MQKVSKETILKYMNPLNKIGLIKEYREYSRQDLSYCKNAVESALEVPLTSVQAERYNQDKYTFVGNRDNYTLKQLCQRERSMMALFGINPVAVESKDMQLKNAITAAIDNWEVLGFANAKAAVEMALCNF